MNKKIERANKLIQIYGFDLMATEPQETESENCVISLFDSNHILVGDLVEKDATPTMCVYRTEDGKYTFCYEVCVASVCYHSDMSGTPDSTEWVAFQEIEIVENGQRREIYKTVEFNAPLEAVLSYLSMVLRETVCEIVDVWDEEDAA